MKLGAVISLGCGKTLSSSLLFQKGAFFRFTPIFKKEVALDESNNATLINMIWETKVYMRKQINYVDILRKLILYGDYP
ncbi:hypothetical protein PMAYCL1PPCAC_23040, partial [Pristionchus mayeri]